MLIRSLYIPGVWMRRIAVYSVGMMVGIAILAMASHGALASSSATFAGAATIHVVGTTASGMLVQVDMSSVPYVVDATPSTLTLTLPTLGMSVGGPVVSGAISIGPSRAFGGGIIGGVTPSQMGFTASPSGGEFQCQNAGFTAGFILTLPNNGPTVTIIQMDVHGAVTSGTYVLA